MLKSHEFLKFNAKQSPQCGSHIRQRLCKRRVEQVYKYLAVSVGTRKHNLGKGDVMRYRKHCLITVTTQKSNKFSYLGCRNISGKKSITIIYSDLGIKPGEKLFDLNDKFKAALIIRLSEVNFLNKDALSMVSSNIYGQILIESWEKYL